MLGIIDKASSSLLRAQSVEEMERVVGEWTAHLQSAFFGNDAGSYIHAAADALCELAHSYTMMVGGETADEEGRHLATKVGRMSKKLGRVRRLLTSPLLGPLSPCGEEKQQFLALPDPSGSITYSIAVVLSRG